MMTLEEAWSEFASQSIQHAPDPVYRAMEVSFYFGAAHVYRHFLIARNTANPAEEIRQLFEELDFFMATLPYSDEGHA